MSECWRLLAGGVGGIGLDWIGIGLGFGIGNLRRE